MKRTRTQITIETDEVLVVRRRTNFVGVWCPRCAGPVWVVTPDEDDQMIPIFNADDLGRWKQKDDGKVAQTAPPSKA